MKLTPLQPSFLCAGVAAFSVLSLAMALTAQYGFAMHPCVLCVYQRFPFAIVILLGLAGVLRPRMAKPMLALSGLAFFVNGVIASYHSGVERKWWAGLSGCSTPDMSGSIEDLLARIESTSVARCDEIPWSLFGLSMANYNVIACFGMAALILVYLLCLRRQAPIA